MSKKYVIPWLRDYFGFHWKGVPYKYPQEDDKRCCQKMQEQANIDAFLQTIRKCEGTDVANGYLLLFGYELFGSFEKHPNILIEKGGYATTAAGAYQFLHQTWAGLDLPDFSPENQDEGAIKLIQRRGALQDVKAGRIESATEKCSWEWASMPPGRYGNQQRVSMNEVKRYFKQAGGKKVNP